MAKPAKSKLMSINSGLAELGDIHKLTQVVNDLSRLDLSLA